MSAVLDRALHEVYPDRAADCDRNDAAMRQPLRRFLILIGPRENARLTIECMARDSVEATQRHMALAKDERLEVRALP